MKNIRFIFTLVASIFIVSGLTGCISIARTDTNTDQSFVDPVEKIGSDLTAEQAGKLVGRTMTGPEISLFGGNLSLGFFRWAKGVTEQYNGSEFNHGSAAFSKSAGEGIASETKGRRGKVHTFGAAKVESEAQTKDLMDGLNGLAQKYLDSTPAGQALLAKKAAGETLSDSDIDAVLEDEDMPADIRSQVEGLKTNQ